YAGSPPDSGRRIPLRQRFGLRRIDEVRAKTRTVSDARNTAGGHARPIARNAVANRFRVGNWLAEYRLVSSFHRLYHIFALGDLITVRGKVEIDAVVENIAFPFANFFANRFDLPLDRQRRGAGQCLYDYKHIRRWPRSRLSRDYSFDSDDFDRG